MISNKAIKIIFFLTTGVFWVFIVGFSLVSAAGTPYVMLEKIPGTSFGNISGTTDFNTYFSGLYRLSMSLALVLAMFQLSRGGFEYLTTDAFGKKETAKETIRNALFGLVLILVSFLLLKTINPDLININMNIPCVGQCGDTAVVGGGGEFGVAQVQVTNPLGNYLI